MGFFQTIIWVFLGVIAITFYLSLLGKYVSKGFHIGGLEIPKEKYQTIKKQYNMGIVVLIMVFFVTPFVFPNFKETPNAGETDNTTTRIISTDEYTVKNQEQVIAFIQQLFSDRPEMKKYISDIEFIRPTLIDLREYDYTFEDYGWKKEIHIEIKLKDKTSLPRNWRADGQILHFYIGSGFNPGVIAKKDVSQLFADMPLESGDSFVSLPNMIGIDDIGL